MQKDTAKILQDNKTLFQDVETLRKGLQVANRTRTEVQEENDGEEFEREEDSAVLRLSTNAVVERQAVMEAISQWMADCDLTDDLWSIRGGTGLQRSWVLHFAGPYGLACRRARKAFQCGDKGEWRKLSVKGPSGASSQFFCGFDQNPKN